MKTFRKAARRNGSEARPLGPSGPLWLAFDQHDIEVMATVLEAAWNALRCRASESALPENAAATRMLLARRIIARARGGEMNHGQLLMRALDGFFDNEQQGSPGWRPMHGQGSASLTA